jgi:acetolactate synthase I/II/III large subunit
MPKMRVSDYIAQALVKHGVSDVFMLTGGGSMHLNDAFGRTPGLRALFTHHEQAAAIAAESYCRLSGRMAALNVTTGPGGVNALNGVYGAYVDSIAMIIVSGQVKRETFAPNYDTRLRQLGDQEVDIVSMVRGITKYAVVLQDPQAVRKTLEKALWLAQRGRPGPVWIDVPIDVQGAIVETDTLEAFNPADTQDRIGESPNTAAEESALVGSDLDQAVQQLMAELCSAKRPIVLVGAGVRISGQHQQFLEFVERLGIAVVTGWNAHDAIANDHSLYVGRPGSVGDRGGNFAVQTADYVLVLGSRLNIRQVSYSWASFARDARVAMVDIDAAELAKPTLSIHRPIHADLRDFFASAAASRLPESDNHHSRAQFLERCRTRSAQYPVVLAEYWEQVSPINPYCFGQALFEALDDDDIIVTGDGTACVTVFQAADIKSQQRLYTNSGCASMGYDLPAAIGAFYASGGKQRIICLAGDGSIMMNLQELQTIAGTAMPVKIFVLNNDGYHSIRQAQQNYFPDNIVGCGPDSGVTFPNYQKLAAGFQIPSTLVETHAGLAEAIRAAIAGDGPHICEVMLDKAQAFSPKLASRRLDDGTMVSPALEDMAPFLSREELAEAMDVSEGAS